MKKYFVEVQTYCSTTKLGKAIAAEVRELYDKSIVSDGAEALRMIRDINLIKLQKEKQFPQCKPMNLLIDIEGKYTTPHIDLRPANKFNDNFAFSLTMTEVRHEYISEEGGEA